MDKIIYTNINFYFFLKVKKLKYKIIGYPFLLLNICPRAPYA